MTDHVDASPSASGGENVAEHAADGPLPGPGRHLVEASAGTGKTFALAAMVTRLVAEQDVGIDGILVVTFTRAAAAELRDRIRRRLVDAARALATADPDDDDVVHRCLLRGAADGRPIDDGVRAERRERLARAVVGFDTATITTIHGFCQQVLKSLGVTSGHNPDAVLVQDTTGLVSATCSDALARASLRDELTIARTSLVKFVDIVLGNPGVSVVAVSGEPDDEQRVDMVTDAAGELRRRLGSTGLLSYDGLLEAVRDALVAHPDAAQRMASQFPVALVDEFQDTDPVQWEVLRSLYTTDGVTQRPGTRLVLVGDPKQAIYAFRGGDIHTYLSAAEAARHSTLPVNWRSDGALLDALNGLCDGWTLGDRRIRYRSVRPAPDHSSRRLVDRDHRPVAPLQVRCAAKGLDPAVVTGNKPQSVPADPARAACIDDVVRAVVELFEAGVRIPTDPSSGDGPDSRPIIPSDIAVLVHANRWAAPIQRRLVRAGIPAVVTGGSSVAETPAAGQWRILLDALARPSDPTRARAVALSWFGDGDPQWVADSSTGDGSDLRLAALQSQLQSWSAVLRTDGVAALLAVLRSEVSVVERILTRAAGERDLTDLDHLGELLHRATSGHPVGPETVRSVLDEMLQVADDDPEAIKRRIDTDAPAVQIMTLHAAKGLEFPVVFCPSLWNLQATASPRLYPAEDGTGRHLDVSTGESAVVKQAKDRARAEVAGQQARLTYVGMTRAVHLLVLWWAAHRSAPSSPIGHLLLDGADPPMRLEEHVGRLRQRLEACGIAHVADVVEVLVDQPVPTHLPLPVAEVVPPAGSLSVAHLDRTIDRRVGRWSFTAVAARAVQDDAIRGTGSGPRSVRHDPDDPTLGDGSDDDEQDPPPPVLFDGLGAGASFGTLVHDAMEHVDFAGDLETQLADLLRRRSWAGDAARRARLVRAIAASIRTPLGGPFGDLRLSDLRTCDRLNELEFEIPLVTSPDGERVSAAQIGRVLLRHDLGDDDVTAWAERLADGSIDVEVGGHLTGSIDLLLRVPADVAGGCRYSVVDYKTTRLGSWAEPDVIANYRPQDLGAVMSDHHYPLQAALYSVALHRYLRWRLDGYDPAAHLGPVGYLFVRGMVGDRTPVHDGRRCGVFDWWVPPAAVVELSELLDGIDVGVRR